NGSGLGPSRPPPDWGPKFEPHAGHEGRRPDRREPQLVAVGCAEKGSRPRLWVSRLLDPPELDRSETRSFRSMRKQTRIRRTYGSLPVGGPPLCASPRLFSGWNALQVPLRG